MKIVIDDNIPYIRGVFEPYAQVVYLQGKAICRDVVEDADALLVRTRTKCGSELLEGSEVRLVATATIGTDHIDKVWCESNGVEVVSAPGCNAGGVLQWVSGVFAFLTATRGMKPLETTLGIVGVGNVGSLVEKYASMWGFNVLRSDPPRERTEGLGRQDGYVPFEELAGQSDIVTFHVPFVKQGEFATANLAGKEFFDRLRTGAVVVNASRGGVVDEEVLLKNINLGKCSACLDTWANEPDINAELLQKVLIATTHIAGYSVQGKANASAAVVAAVARKFGMPLKGWYPVQVARVERTEISYNTMCASISDFCDLEGETTILKNDPSVFEIVREEYSFREEYF